MWGMERGTSKSSTEQAQHLPCSPEVSSRLCPLLAEPGLRLMVKSFAPRDRVRVHGLGERDQDQEEISFRAAAREEGATGVRQHPAKPAPQQP